MNKKIKISVIIPLYNGAEHIGHCLEYIIHQTYSNLEIIIVDDGSTDNSPQICQELVTKDNRIRIIRQPNSGPANARNNGLNHATGDYVHFHDADDFVELDYYEKMAQVANQTGADVICGGVQESGYNFPHFNQVQICMTLHDKIAVPRAHLFNVVWRYLYRREFLNNHNIRFPVDVFIGEDKIFMMQATYLARTLATAPGTVYHCLNCPTSLGKNFKKIMAGRTNGRQNIRDTYQQLIENTGIADEIAQIKRGKLASKRNYNFLRMPLWTRSTYTNGDVQYHFLGIPLCAIKLSRTRKKVYVFGMCVYRTYDTVI